MLKVRERLIKLIELDNDGWNKLHRKKDALLYDNIRRIKEERLAYLQKCQLEYWFAVEESMQKECNGIATLQPFQPVQQLQPAVGEESDSDEE